MGLLASETSVARPNSAVAKAFYLHLAQALTINFSQHLLVHLFFTVRTCIQSFSLGAQGNLLLFEAIMAVWHNRLIWKFDKISPALAFGLAGQRPPILPAKIQTCFGTATAMLKALVR